MGGLHSSAEQLSGDDRAMQHGLLALTERRCQAKRASQTAVHGRECVKVESGRVDVVVQREGRNVPSVSSSSFTSSRALALARSSAVCNTATLTRQSSSTAIFRSANPSTVKRALASMSLLGGKVLASVSHSRTALPLPDVTILARRHECTVSQQLQPRARAEHRPDIDCDPLVSQNR